MVVIGVAAVFQEVDMKMKLRCSLVVLVLALIGTVAVAGEEGIVGTWEGTLNAGGASLRVVFHISEAGDALKATMDSPDQNAFGIPVSKVSFKDQNLSIEVAAAAGGYQGKLNKETQQIEGKWTQSGQSLPLVLAKKTK